MLRIYVTRYYGNPYITKSVVIIENGSGKVLFSGEGREVGFKDYTKGEDIKNGSLFCLGAGEYKLKETSMTGMRLCWRISDDRKHRGFKICCFDAQRQNVEGFLNIGHGEGTDAPFRRLKDIEKAKERLIHLIERHYKEDVTMVVRNDNVEQDFTDPAGDFCTIDDYEDEEEEIEDDYLGLM